MRELLVALLVWLFAVPMVFGGCYEDCMDDYIVAEDLCLSAYDSCIADCVVIRDNCLKDAECEWTKCDDEASRMKWITLCEVNACVLPISPMADAETLVAIMKDVCSDAVKAHQEQCAKDYDDCMDMCVDEHCWCGYMEDPVWCPPVS